MANNEKSGHRNRGKGGQRMKYEEYKDSGVEWIGEVPSHWEVMRFKDFTSLQTTASDNMNKIGLENIEGKTGRFIESDSEFEGNGIAFNIGDVVYGKLRPYLQKVWIATFSGNAVGDFFVFRPKDNCYNQYLFYCMLSDGFTSMCNGSTVGAKMPRVSSDFIRSLHYYLPPLSEQQAIATYLDEKCGEVNCAIDVQKKKIELLNELKQTIITDAVTKGLNPNAPMKDSGVEWIGKVPEHWKVMRLRFACEFRNGYTPSKTNSDFWENGTIPWYRMEDIRESGRFLNEAKQYITEEAVKGNGLFEAGSFILATTATIGEHAMLIADSQANQQFTNLKIRKLLSNRLSRHFLFYYLFVIDDYCKSTTRTATFPAVNMDDLKNFGVTIPPLQEQQAIIAHIEQETGKIDFQIAKANSRIELLEELKQSIITEAVTGKIKIC